MAQSGRVRYPVRILARTLVLAVGGRSAIAPAADGRAGQLTLMAVSSTTNEVCVLETCLPVNFSVMACPA